MGNGAQKVEKYQAENPIRFISAASLFDGHDVAINIMRRMLQGTGVEVIHLGHNRSVDEVVTAAIDEDVQGIALSSYQGGHIEYFQYAYDLLQQRGAGHIKLFGGGGGVITPDEIKQLEAYGITRIYSPEDGQALGLQGIINDMVQRCDFALPNLDRAHEGTPTYQERAVLSRHLSALENGVCDTAHRERLQQEAAKLNDIPVLGITGTGGAGKSSLTDELICRFRTDAPDVPIAVIAIDPSKRRTGGALLGDRIRMNAIHGGNIFMRSMATRHPGSEVPGAMKEIVALCKLAGFKLIIIETPGIGQGDAGIVPYVDFSLYVMTPEFGAASQLEKIDMLDFADIVAINKFDRKGGEDALRDVRKQMQRNQEAFGTQPADMPVYGSIASLFNDDGTTALYLALIDLLNGEQKGHWESTFPVATQKYSSKRTQIIPGERVRYLAEAASTVRGYKAEIESQSQIARTLSHLKTTESLLDKTDSGLQTLIATQEEKLAEAHRLALAGWEDLKARYQAEVFTSQVRDKTIETDTHTESLSGSKIPKVAWPNYHDAGDRLSWLALENVPGEFPYTAGVFHFKRSEEAPGRMFAGEGDPYRTNKRFKLLSEDSPAIRLSTAFDSVTLYGFDPATRPDIYGKIGNSGVSIATLDDMRVLFDGFDLTAANTSVSMTINGPAPTILAMFLNTAIDQQVAAQGKPYEAVKSAVLQQVRGTVQADILKEDQGQNTCIFSTEFSLKMMADIQEYFIAQKVRNFYSVSISGYHIAEAGANPITQLAFTLANGLTYVESYLARGMAIDDFAPNLSFFFSNGMDPEYAVMGRVARRIWAILMREKYGANARSQKLKYHVQTSGRSLHAQEMTYNDIRTTLEALIAIYDNCNSLHTNAFDEAITTPTDASVRKALAIQLVINQEWGVAKCENPSQGAFIIEQLTELVEEAVLSEFERLSDRGGVLGAMERGYQRGKIQDESIHYEILKHDGRLPIVGVNTFLSPDGEEVTEPHELARSTDEEKQSQLRRLSDFQKQHAEDAPAMIERIKTAVRNNDNVFAVLMDAVRICSLGQISEAFFEVGGRYRRNV